MAFGAKAVVLVRTGGSDTNCGGGFNAGNANMATDLTATSGNTSSPVVASASYNFVAGDVGARVFIQSGTNWIKGWYTIASVASNAATLTASVGNATIYNGNNISGVSTVAGCATTASPTGGVWSVDYSNQDAAQIAYTDLIGVTTTYTSVLKPVGKNIIGNYISVTAGTNYTVQRVEVVSTSGTTATVDRTFGGTATGAATAWLGGALASPGLAGGVVVGGNSIFVRSGTYTLGSSTANVTTGKISIGNASPAYATPNRIEGYGTIPGDLGTRPVISAGAITGIVILNLVAQLSEARNLTVDGNGQTSVNGITSAGGSIGIRVYDCKAQNCTTTGFGSNFATVYQRCIATGCSGTAGFFFDTSSFGAIVTDCEAYGNTTVGIYAAGGGAFVNCISSANSGAGSDGFTMEGQPSLFINCVSYGNGRHGFNMNLDSSGVLMNCIAEGNAGWGYKGNLTLTWCTTIINCAGYNNTSGNVDTADIPKPAVNFVTNTTGSFFTNAAGGDFSLNATANQGALARGAGYPGLMPRGTSTGYLDIGAIQHADPAGGTGPIGKVVNVASIGTY